MKLSDQQICDILIRPDGYKILLDLYYPNENHRPDRTYAILDKEEAKQFRKISMETLQKHLGKIGFDSIVSNFQRIGAGSCVYRKNNGNYVYSYFDRGKETVYCECPSLRELEVCFLELIVPRKIKMITSE